jgi:L,D-transpeptidase YbiS
LVSGQEIGDAAVSDPGSSEVKALTRQIAKARVRGLFILVDTARNRLYLRKGGQVLLEAVCSTGSGVELVSADKKWTFRTPRGAFRVISKTHDPVWRKPDWAFLEEGEPVPRMDRDRFESGVLGEYALGIGDGYFIHGTLYTRLLGTNVTHGCIRLGGDDLAVLAKKVPIGTRVFIY